MQQEDKKEEVDEKEQAGLGPTKTNNTCHTEIIVLLLEARSLGAFAMG